MTAGLLTALIVECPAAEPVVGRHRRRLDRAAALGVPAHVTVVFPFVPLRDLTERDHDHLDALFSAVPPFELVGARTGWFGDTALYVEPADPRPLVALVDLVVAAFPQAPPYGGAFPEVVPHLTIGHDHPRAELRAAEREVGPLLPVRQPVECVDLWSGPAPESGVGRWQRVRRYPFAAPGSTGAGPGSGRLDARSGDAAGQAGRRVGPPQGLDDRPQRTLDLG
ncbi:2'-5' RNA ligase family protein [Oryzobacter terrae]|uniref:2'-5' RNA ligase family protein n=1 Tax=Oryzobacter terrae TaxID=1620385 RepID=UPI00366CE550